MPDHQWFVGQEVAEDALLPSKKITKVTPSGQFTTDDGRRYTVYGHMIGRVGRYYYGMGHVVKPTTPEDAKIRERAMRIKIALQKLSALQEEVDAMARSCRDMARRRDVNQSEIDSLEAFLAKLGRLED